MLFGSEEAKLEGVNSTCRDTDTDMNTSIRHYSALHAPCTGADETVGGKACPLFTKLYMVFF